MEVRVSSIVFVLTVVCFGPSPPLPHENLLLKDYYHVIRHRTLVMPPGRDRSPASSQVSSTRLNSKAVRVSAKAERGARSVTKATSVCADLIGRMVRISSYSRLGEELQFPRSSEA